MLLSTVAVKQKTISMASQVNDSEMDEDMIVTVIPKGVYYFTKER